MNGDKDWPDFALRRSVRAPRPRKRRGALFPPWGLVLFGLALSCASWWLGH